jgi:hypothetical protein
MPAPPSSPAAPNTSAPEASLSPINTPPDSPSVGAGAPNTMPYQPGISATPQNNTPGMDAFLKNFNVKNAFSKEAEYKFYYNNDELIVEAQAAAAIPEAPPEVTDAVPAVVPASMPTPAEAITPKIEDKIEVEDNPNVAVQNNGGKDFDAILDSAFKNVSISDIVNKLEDLTNLFKNREIPRQLAIVDLMLDKVGLSSVFSELSEASGKSIEANNYILSRVENILSKLRGSIGVSSVDLKSTAPATAEAAGIKNKIQEDQAKEDRRKQLRKDIENKEVDQNGVGLPAPIVEITEDLSQPVTSPTPAPAPAKA